MEKTLKITEEQAKKLYLEASANLKEILESNFGKATFLKNFRDTVKTYEDACEIIGEKPIDEQPFNGLWNRKVGNRIHKIENYDSTNYHILIRRLLRYC